MSLSRSILHSTRTFQRTRDMVSPLGGKLLRLVIWGVAIYLLSDLIVNLAINPTKRVIQLTAAVIFLAFVLVAHPRRALYFTICVLPFPAYTTVGATTTLLIWAVAGLALIKHRDISSLKDSIPLARAALTAFLILAALTLYQSPREYLHFAVDKLVAMASAALLYYLIVKMICRRDQLVTLMKIAMIVSAALALLAILQFLFPTTQFLPEFFKFSKKVATMEEIRSGMIRSFATFPGYELFAEYVTISIILTYALLRREHNLAKKTLWIGACLLQFGALFATGTRAGIIVLAFGIAYYFMRTRSIVPRREVAQTVFVVLAVFYISIPFMGSYYGVMFERLSELSAGANDGSIRGRSVVLEQALEAVARNPLAGHGLQETPDTFRGGVGMHIHNLYVTLAFKMGLPGLCAFIVFAFAIMRASLAPLRSRLLDNDMRGLLAALHVAVAMLLLDEFKIEFTRTALTMHVSFMFFGLLAAAIQVANAERQGELAPARG